MTSPSGVAPETIGDLIDRCLAEGEAALRDGAQWWTVVPERFAGYAALQCAAKAASVETLCVALERLRERKLIRREHGGQSTPRHLYGVMLRIVLDLWLLAEVSDAATLARVVALARASTEPVGPFWDELGVRIRSHILAEGSTPALEAALQHGRGDPEDRPYNRQAFVWLDEASGAVPSASYAARVMMAGLAEQDRSAWRAQLEHAATAAQ